MSGNTAEKRNFTAFLMKSDGAVSALVVLMGFLCATLLVVIVGRSPAGIYKAILQVVTGFNANNGKWNIRYVGEWLNYSVPFILCGFSMAFAARSGLFNIGGEGQYIIGMTVAQLIALTFPPIPFIHLVLALVLATAAGVIWGGVVGYLKARFEVSEVVATIMLNYIALFLSRIVTLAIPGTNTYKTPNFPETASLRLNFLTKLTNSSALNAGFFIMLVCVLVYWFLMEKTNVGFGLRATGFNKDAAKASGIPVVASIVIAMAVSGAFAGLGGGIVALGSFKYGRVIAGMDNYGFTGIAVALVGNNTALGTFFAGLLFGMLQAAQPIMQSNKIPKEITFIIQGLVVVFISLKAGFRLFLIWRERRRTEKLESANLKKSGGTQDSIGKRNAAAYDDDAAEKSGVSGKTRSVTGDGEA
ncbi:ABC transporter permease [Treponema parvum]|uniref:ABC transporter permease n=1 Tax=Treponema parvum TaxID=138851 RepID=UPI001AEC1CF1|nr:ABC transporter permease [Treponema parvum]QTQ15939.1 ABC transporter permease [Treponema parvum]